MTATPRNPATDPHVGDQWEKGTDRITVSRVKVTVYGTLVTYVQQAIGRKASSVKHDTLQFDRVVSVAKLTKAVP